MYTYKILLIEDNPFSFQTWQLVLSQSLWSYKLDWAVNEKAANKLMAKTSYDIIISDVVLSGRQTGIDIWRTIDPQHCHFIFATRIKASEFASLVAGEDRPYCLLEKPLNVGRCMQLIQQLTRSSLKDDNRYG